MVRILVVDGHEIARRGVREILRGQDGCEIVAEAADGEAALAAARLHRPDVAIVEWALPTLGGAEVTRLLCKASPSTEVLIFTLRESEALAVEAMRAGARGYLLKSAVRSDLLKAVASVARHQTYISCGGNTQALLEEIGRRRQSGSPSVLSWRQREVLRLIALGMGNKQIARDLNLSLKTVETHRAALNRKIGTSSAVLMVRYAIRNGLVAA